MFYQKNNPSDFERIQKDALFHTKYATILPPNPFTIETNNRNYDMMFLPYHNLTWLVGYQDAYVMVMVILKSMSRGLSPPSKAPTLLD